MTSSCPKSNTLPGTFKSFFSSRSEIISGLPVLFCRRQGADESIIAFVDTVMIVKMLQNGPKRTKIVSLLSAEEEAIFATYSYAKRQREWLAGRLACKFAVLRLLNETFTDYHFSTFSVLPGEQGAPELVFQKSPATSPSISISHSGRFAVAMTGFGQSCGIDIQEVTAKIMNVVPQFALPEEIRLLETGIPGFTEQQRLTLLWSAKEALKKSLLHDQPAIFKGILLQSLSEDTGTISLQLCSSLAGPDPVEVTAHHHEGYILAHTASGVLHA